MRRWIGIFLLVAAIFQLGFRGAQRVRNDLPMWDFASVYAATKCWMHGQDCYDVSAVVQTWHSSGFFAGRDVSYFATVYPPSSLLLLAPFAMLPASFAIFGWLLLTLVLLAIQYVALGDIAQIPRRDPRFLILIGASLATGAYQFGILSGQLSIPAISLCIICFWLAGAGKDLAAGLLLGLAFALKPQIAGPFIAYYFFLRRFRLVAPAVLVGGAVWIVAIAAMHATHIDWVAGWTQSMAATTQVGNVNDYGWTNRFRDEIVDLKMVVVGFVHNPRALSVATECIFVALFAWFVAAFPRGVERSSRDELLRLSVLSALALLPVYHRVYDVALLTTALAWALAEMDGPRRKNAIALLIPMAVFLVPFDSIKSVGSRLHRLGAVSEKWWWQSLVATHYAWALLATTIVLLAILRRHPPRRQPGQS